MYRVRSAEAHIAVANTKLASVSNKPRPDSCRRRIEQDTRKLRLLFEMINIMLRSMFLSFKAAKSHRQFVSRAAKPSDGILRSSRASSTQAPVYWGKRLYPITSMKQTTRSRIPDTQHLRISYLRLISTAWLLARPVTAEQYKTPGHRPCNGQAYPSPSRPVDHIVFSEPHISGFPHGSDRVVHIFLGKS